MESSDPAQLATALIFLGIALVVVIAIFIVLREFWCWYWKTSELSGKADKIIDGLEQLKVLNAHADQAIQLLRLQRNALEQISANGQEKKEGGPNR